MRRHRRWGSARRLRRMRRRCGNARPDPASTWDLAEQLGWAETYDAEYVALTQLQADALVTMDTALARRVEGIVPTATIATLRTA
jgi:predicted nucleic acid-binding protein